MPATPKLKSDKAAAEKTVERKDLYEVLGVMRTSTDQEIKSAYRRMALKYHPDKNANDPKAADMFKEVTLSYTILSDPDKRRQYDTAGFEAVESENQEMELDLSSLGAVNTMFAALFSKLGVPIKTTVSATILEEALNGAVSLSSLSLGQPLRRKVDKQCAHFYSVKITKEEARAGFICRVYSNVTNVSCAYERGCIREHLQIENLTTKCKWLYFPAIYPLTPVPGHRIEVTWLSHWSVMPHRDVRAGDQLKVSFQSFVSVPVKCGINIVYEVDGEDDSSMASAYHNAFRTVDLSVFEIQHKPGTYILGFGEDLSKPISLID